MDVATRVMGMVTVLIHSTNASTVGWFKRSTHIKFKEKLCIQHFYIRFTEAGDTATQHGDTRRGGSTESRATIMAALLSMQ